MENKKALYADLSLLLVAIIWGSGFIVTKNALDHITPYYMLGFRFIIASAVLGIISFKKLRKATIKDFKAGAIVGLFLFGGFATQTIGMKYTTVGNSAFITASNVVMVPFFYFLLTKRRLDKFEIFGAVLCFIGIGILSLDKNLTISFGDFLILLCAIFFALHIVSVGYFAGEIDPYVIATVQLFVVAVLSMIFAFCFEPKVTAIRSDMIIPILYLAIFSSMLAFLIQNVAQVHTSSTHAAIILSLESVFGSTFSIIFLKEALTFKFIVGCLAILISVLASETKFEFLKLNQKAK